MSRTKHEQWPSATQCNSTASSVSSARTTGSCSRLCAAPRNRRGTSLTLTSTASPSVPIDLHRFEDDLRATHLVVLSPVARAHTCAARQALTQRARPALVWWRESTVKAAVAGGRVDPGCVIRARLDHCFALRDVSAAVRPAQG